MRSPTHDLPVGTLTETDAEYASDADDARRSVVAEVLLTRMLVLTGMLADQAQFLVEADQAQFLVEAEPASLSQRQRAILGIAEQLDRLYQHLLEMLEALREGGS